MALASESQKVPCLQRGLSRRTSQNSSSAPIIPIVQAVDFCRSKPQLVELEQQLYSLASGNISLREVTETCLSLLRDCDNTKEVFNVFCSCSWVDRYKDPIICQLFYELVNIQQDSNADVLLLAELEIACEELLRVLTHLGTPNTLQLNVVSLLYNLSRLNGLPSSHLEAVKSYLEEITRALWPYSRPSAPDLWGSEAFCDAQCDVLKACGKSLEENCPVNTERTFQKINGKLISGDISQYARFRLLEIRELRSSGWKLSGATSSYYKAAYYKFKNQPRKDTVVSDPRVPSRNGFKKINSFGESKSQTESKPVTVLRINESELRKSCDDLHAPLVTREAIAKETLVRDDQRSCSSADDGIALPAQQGVSINSVNNDFGDKDASLNETGTTPPLNVGMEEKDRGEGGLDKGTTACPVSQVSQDLTEHITERASSPCSNEGSDDVFASTVARDKVVPAMHRGDFKKLRRPFKSDSSASSTSESPLVRATLLSDSNASNSTDESTLVYKQSQSTEVVTPDSLSTEVIASNGQLTEVVTSNSQSTELVALVDLKVTSELTGKASPVTVSTGSGDHDSNILVTEDSKSASENWRARKISNTDESPAVVNGGVRPATENWRKRSSSGDLTELQSSDVSNATNENWRDRKINSSPDFWSSGSHNENWRGQNSISVDETARDVNSTSGGQSKRYSTGDIHIQLERQNSNEKGKRSPGGGFGLPKQQSQELKEASSEEYHEDPTSEVLEVQLSEEESQDLRWRKLGEIQTDTGCRISLDRDKCVVLIRGDPSQCKVAKKRVYSVVAALQEEFGALVPLSDEILEHLQSEGCSMLAERLALCSGAYVKMINDSQLFISGYRSCVNLAKTQLAKIKVMLKYTDDPDVISPSQENGNEDDSQKVERLFAALEGRPRSFTQTAPSSTDLKPKEGSLSRDFLLSCASSPLAQQRPSDLSLERTEDWVKAIVLVNGRRGDLVFQEHKRGFGLPNLDSRTRHPSV